MKGLNVQPYDPHPRLSAFSTIIHMTKQIWGFCISNFCFLSFQVNSYQQTGGLPNKSTDIGK